MKKIVVLMLSLILSFYSFAITNLRSETMRSEVDNSEICEIEVFKFDSKQEKENKISKDKKYYMEKNNFTAEEINEGVIMSADYLSPLGHTIGYKGFYKNNQVNVYGNSDKTEEIKKIFYKEMAAIGYKPKDNNKTELTKTEIETKKKGEETNIEGFGQPQDIANKPLMSREDGVALPIKNFLKEITNNSKTLEYTEVYKLEELSNKFYAQRVKFKSENEYGKLIMQEYIFIMSPNGKESKVTGGGTAEEYQKFRKDNDIITVKFYN